MKKLITILAIIATVSANAQSRGTYGTLQPYTQLTATLFNNSLTQVTADTLKGVDTSYAYFKFNNPYRVLFDMTLTQKADSVSGTVILQGSDDNSTWQSITGITTICTTCSGASATLTKATGINHATFDVGQTVFNYWRMRVVGTRSTDTTVVTAKAIYSY